MITSIFIYLMSFFIQILAIPFAAINYVIPLQFKAALGYWLNHLNYARGFIDVDTIFQALGTILLFLGFLKIVILAKWVWGMLPWVGKHADLPNVSREIIDTSDSKGRHHVIWKERSKF